MSSVTNPKATRVILREVMRAVPGQLNRMVALVGLSILFSGAGLLTAKAIGELTGQAAQMHGMALLLPAVGLAGLGYALEIVLGYLYGYAQKVFQERTDQQFRMHSARVITGATQSWMESQKLGDLIGRMQQGTEMTAQLLTNIVPGIVMQLVRLIVYGAWMFMVSWQLTLLYLALFPLIILMQSALSKPIQKYFTLLQQQEGHANALAQDILNNRRTVKAFNAQPILRRWYDERLQKVFSTAMRTSWVATPLMAIGFVSAMFPIIVLCLGGSFLVANQTVTLAIFMSVYILANSVLMDALHITDIFSQLRQACAFAQRTLEIWQAPQEQARWELLPKQDVEPSDAVLALDHVWFSYDAVQEETQEPHWALKDVSLTIHEGEKVAIVGSSGCGKSTLLKLISGLYAPQKGSLAMYGKPYGQWSLDTLREQISLVLQDPFLYPTTIKENIAWGFAGTASEHQIEKACQMANLELVLQDAPDGLDTLVGERGGKLSGGQLQRVSIARAFIKDAPLLLLDEATSALDSIAEKSIQESFDVLMQGRTSLTVAHRFSTIRGADRIIVMQEGCIVEEGSHEVLLARNGVYTQLIQMQSNHVDEEGVQKHETGNQEIA